MTAVTPGPSATSTSASVRVVIAHADQSYRELIASLLRKSGIGVVDAVPDGEAAVAAARSAAPAPALVLVGDDLAGQSVAETTRRLTRAAPASRVLVFGTGAAEEGVSGTLGAGAAGYVRIDEHAERLDVTVRIAIALLGRREDPPGP